MDYEAIRAGMAQAIPFNTHVGLEVVELGPGRGVIRLPDRAELRNHVGSQHAGAPRPDRRTHPRGVTTTARGDSRPPP